MGWLGKLFGRGAPVAYLTWHRSRGKETCPRCAELDGTCWLPSADFKGPPLREGCTCAGGCTCRTLPVRMDEAWGPGNAEWIAKQGGVVSGERMAKFLSS